MPAYASGVVALHARIYSCDVGASSACVRGICMGEAKNEPRAESDVRRLVEARLSEIEGMATVGMLLEGTIHRINNPLASLLASLEQLCDRLRHVIPTDEQVEAVRIAEEAREEGARVATAVRELAQLLPTDNAGPVEVNDVVLGVMVMLERQYGTGLSARRQLAPLSPIRSREARLAQVLLSAGASCVDAAHLKGAKSAELEVCTEARDGGAAVRFALSGIDGVTSLIPPRRVDILRGVVQLLGGSLAIDATSVSVWLPGEFRAYDSENEVSLKQRESAPPRGELRVLIVDDEPSIHRALERGLREIGYSGRAAIELLEGGAMFDVVLSDVIMPEGTGVELADWMERHRPRLKRRLILMTGMGEAHTDSHPEVITVGKPFDLPALRELVCQVATRT
jgi:CheY-like chemotaxis protein